MSGYVTFVMSGRRLAGRLGEVREVVRATGIEPLAGARAPVTGLLVLRGTPLPVVDLRSAADAGDTGDLLVLQTPDGALGLAVDEVLAVLGPDELVTGPGVAAPGLPAYVLDVRHDAAGAPVLVVSLTALAGLVPA
ncbi:MAG: chemotaxis protein CheW [Actinomycetes bacterium]